MKKVLATVFLSLFFSIEADAGTNNEGKNKKYVYKYLSDLKTLMKITCRLRATRLHNSNRYY